MPRLACWSCGRTIYATSPLESLFAEERRCPRCGTLMNLERRDARASRARPSPEPPGRAGSAARGRAPRRGATVRRSPSRALAPPARRRFGGEPRARHLSRARPHRRLHCPRPAGGRRLDGRGLESVGRRAGTRPGRRRSRFRRHRRWLVPSPIRTSSCWQRHRPRAWPCSTCLAASPARLWRPEAVVTDVASTKTLIMERAAAHGIRFVGGHPMAGKETSGFGAASAGLFAGRPWVVIAARAAGGDAIERVESMVRATGARPVRMDAAAHDAAVAAISHLPLVAAAALVEVAAGAPGGAVPAGLAGRVGSRCVGLA